MVYLELNYWRLRIVTNTSSKLAWSFEGGLTYPIQGFYSPLLIRINQDLGVNGIKSASMAMKIIRIGD